MAWTFRWLWWIGSHWLGLEDGSLGSFSFHTWRKYCSGVGVDCSALLVPAAASVLSRLLEVGGKLFTWSLGVGWA